MCTHTIELYEPVGFEGRNPIHVNSVGVVKTRDRNEFFLVSLEEPFKLQGELITQLILQPRYFGDKIQRAVRDMCTVSVMCVKPGIQMSIDQFMQLSDVMRWGCGKVNPARSRVGEA